jgi:hypothetical protein
VTTHRRSTRAVTEDNLLDTPVATIVHLLGALAFCLVFVLNGGELPDDSVEFFAILLGANAGVSVGRGLAARKAG